MKTRSSMLSTVLLVGAVLLLALSLPGCNKDEGDGGSGVTLKSVTDLLPDSGEISGWNRGSIYLYADDQESLAEGIDGAVDIYMQYGFQEAVRQSYDDTSGQVAMVLIDIFDFGTGGDAGNVYEHDSIRPAVSDPVDDLGDEARLYRGPVTFTLDFIQGKYWISLTVQRGDQEEDDLNALNAFAAHISAEIG